MSRASAIEAIAAIFDDYVSGVDESRDYSRSVISLLADHGFVSLDDVAEGWKATKLCPFNDSRDECLANKCPQGFNSSISTPKECFLNDGPATIQEVLDGKAEKEG